MRLTTEHSWCWAGSHTARAVPHPGPDPHAGNHGCPTLGCSSCAGAARPGPLHQHPPGGDPAVQPLPVHPGLHRLPGALRCLCWAVSNTSDVPAAVRVPLHHALRLDGLRQYRAAAGLAAPHHDLPPPRLHSHRGRRAQATQHYSVHGRQKIIEQARLNIYTQYASFYGLLSHVMCCCIVISPTICDRSCVCCLVIYN